MTDDLDGTPPQEPLAFDDVDVAVYGHLPSLVDGITREAPTDETTLVALNQGDPLLTDLTGIATPKVLAQIVGELDITYGPRCRRDSDRYRFRVTFNKLLLAPALRLECIFLKQGNLVYHTISVEFHFNAFSGPDTQIQSYKHSGNVITFTSNGASHTGFNKCLTDPSIKARFGTEEEAITFLLHGFIKPEARHPVTIILHDHDLDDRKKSDFAEIRSRLPGGSGHLLPSIGRVEYACFGEQPGRIVSEIGQMRKPRKLMEKAPRHPMVPLPSSDTFRTVKEAAVELAHSCTTVFNEEAQSLHLWSSVAHRGTLFQYHRFIVVGVNFMPFPKLGCRNHTIQYRLPKNLSATLRFKVPGRATKPEQFSALLMSKVAGLPPNFDAYFVVVSKKSCYFQPGGAVSPDAPDVLPETIVPPSTDPFELSIRPSQSIFTYASQLETISELQEDKNRRWRTVLLNQAHSALEAQNLTMNHGITEEAKAAADEWLINFAVWNQEQLGVIEGIKIAKGGVVIVMGPAGTGKTLLQMALQIYFFKLGFHILALSPANSNANHLAGILAGQAPPVPFLRLYPSSRDHNLDNVVDAGGWHEKRKSLPPPELMFTIDELERGHGLSQKYGVVEAVVSAASDGQLTLNRRLRNGGIAVGEAVNAWDILRDFIKKYKDGTLDEGEGYTAEQHRLGYLACKGHIIGLQRLIVTTTGNVLAKDLIQSFYSAEEEYGVAQVGVMVFVDEAAKDLEVNIWAAVVCKAWAKAMRGVFLFGDEKQLKPTNTSSHGDVVFNSFSARLDISLPLRLVREGFPHHRLLEQRRMHYSLAAFPNQKIYEGALRNGPGMDDTLELRKPGLWKVLSNIIMQSTSLTPLEREHYRTQLSDAKLRLHWIEVRGTREVHPSTNSSIVFKHVDVFFDKIYPMLRDYFDEIKEKMEDSVMIICAYSYALHEYQDRFATLLSNDSSLEKADMPKVLTVDSSQGNESMFVIFDGSFQHGNRVGFMQDVGRANVAITRAREVFWIIGGSMSTMPGRSGRTNLMLEYKRELNGKHSHAFE